MCGFIATKALTTSSTIRLNIFTNTALVRIITLRPFHHCKPGLFVRQRRTRTDVISSGPRRARMTPSVSCEFKSWKTGKAYSYPLAVLSHCMPPFVHSQQRTQRPFNVSLLRNFSPNLTVLLNSPSTYTQMVAPSAVAMETLLDLAGGTTLFRTH